MKNIEQMKMYLDEFLLSLSDEYSMPGCDLSVYIHHQPVYRGMFGYANIAENIPISENTLYNIYSSSKFVTCTAGMQLVERGKIRLDDKLSRYFPEFEKMYVKTPDGGHTEARNAIRIKDLFCMTAGFRYDGYEQETADFINDTNGECPLIELPKYLARADLEFEPSSAYRYSLCHDVLGALIEKVSGMKFSEYLKKNIFEPLEMENTGFYLEELKSQELAMHYSFDGREKPLRELGCRNCLVPPQLKESGGGGLITSVNDYMKFEEALCKGNIILRKPTIDLMRRDHLTPAQKAGYGWTPYGMSYGLGVRIIIDPAQMNTTAGYTSFGWDGAAGSFASVDPEREISIFYAQHLFGSWDYFINSTIRNIVYSFAE